MADALTAIPQAAKTAAAGGTTVAQQVSANPAPAPVPPVATPGSTGTTPTVVTDANIRENTLPDIQQRAQQALATTKNGVINGVAPDGSALSSNGNYIDKAGNQYSSAPASSGTSGVVAGAQTAAASPSTPTTPASQSPADTSSDNEYDDFLKTIFDSNPSTSTQGATTANDPYLTTLSTLKATSDAATQTLIAATQSQFEQRKAQLAATNAASHAGLMQALISNGEARYAPILAGQSMTADEQSGVLALSNIDAQESSAVATLQKAQADSDFQTMSKALDHLDTLREDKINVASKLASDSAAATQALNAAQQKVTDGINSVAQSLAENGAPADVIAAASSAPDVASAIQAGTGYFQDPTSDAGQYQAYVKDAQAKGLTPMTAGDFLAKQKANENYQSAYSSEAGKTAADDALGIGDATTDLTPDPGATGITAAAGISLQAFNYLTQGTASMSRMPAAQRNAIMKEANDWLNKNGIDISTFQSEYTAANNVVAQNVERENNVNTRGGEVTTTADALINDINAKVAQDPLASVHGDEGMSSLRAANVLDILAGNATNNKFAETYSTQIGLLANDLAGYLAASRGATSPEDSDKRDAANMIANGMNSGSLGAFRDTIQSNVAKTAGVVSTQKTAAQQQIWDLFGVGDQFKQNISTTDPKDSVDSWVKSNPDQADTVAKLYEVPGATDNDVWEYIQALNP